LITVKEEFLGNTKTQLAVKLGGWEAIALWLALKGYVSAGNTGGFIPTEAVEHLPGIPKKWQKAMAGLIGCGKLREDGTRGAGLVHGVALGYVLHDYEDHGTPVEVENERRQKARDRKRRWRNGPGGTEAASSHAQSGTEDGTVPGTERDKQAGQDGTGERDGPRSSPVDTRAQADAHPYAGGRTRAPSPAQPSPTAAAAAAAAAQSSGPIPCPPDLELLPGQRGSFETSGIPGWAVDAVTIKFRAKAAGDPSDKRAIEAWRKSLAAAIAGDWNNPRTRPQKPEPDTESRNGGYGSAEEFAI